MKKKIKCEKKEKMKRKIDNLNHRTELIDWNKSGNISNIRNMIEAVRFLIIGLVVVFIFVSILSSVFLVSAFTGSSTNYNLRVKHDLTAETNATSTNLVQRLVGGFQLVGEVLTNSFTGRLGILGTDKTLLVINFTYPIHKTEVPRGSDSVTDEDELGEVDNNINLRAKVYDNITKNPIPGITCYFNTTTTPIGNDNTNSTGDCSVAYAKSALSVGEYDFSVNYSYSGTYTELINKSNIAFHITQYLIPNEVGNKGVATQYVNGQTAVLYFNITKTNATGTYFYDPNLIQVNATDSTTNVHYPDNEFVSGYRAYRVATGQYQSHIVINKTIDNTIRWEIRISDNSMIATTIHADVGIVDGPICGNSLTETGEDCDDGNLVAGDGCSATCTTEEGPPVSCFPEYTKILMADFSEKQIKDVEIGDKVLSYNISNRQIAVAEVLELEAPVREGVYEINGLFNVTDEHPFYVMKKNGNIGWAGINAEKAEQDLVGSELEGEEIYELEVGDKLFNVNRGWVEIKNIKYFSGEIKTYNLKTVDKYNKFFAERFLVHNKGGCEPTWVCGDWSECIDGIQTRTCIDDASCGTFEDKPETERLCGPEECEEDWRCDWTECEEGDEYSYPINCIDLNSCGTEFQKPNKKECGECIPNWECEEWGECEVDYDLNKITLGQPILEGVKKRYCRDLEKCGDDKIEKEICNITVPIETREIEWCYKTYIEIYDLRNNKLVSRMRKYRLAEHEKIDVGFIVGEFKGYCDYCFDNVKNYDEVGLDCGGPNCPACVSEKEWFDWLKWLLWILWLLLLLLILYILYRMYKEMKERRRFKVKKKRYGIKVRVPTKWKRLFKFKIKLKKIKTQDYKRKKRKSKKIMKRLRRQKRVKRLDVRKKLMEWKKQGYYKSE